MPSDDLIWAVSQYKPSHKRSRYELYWNYYEGNHRLAFATEKFRSTFGALFKEFAENVCPAVVDSLVDRLKVTGFRANTASMQTQDQPSPVSGVQGITVPPRKRVSISDPDGQAAWDIWTRNRMDLRSKEVHREAAMMGDAYVIVWPDQEMQAAIWPQLANEVSVQYDPNNPGVVLRGCKRWYDPLEKKWRLNTYTQFEIQKYQSRKTTADPPEEDTGYMLFDEIPNPYGITPVFHFPRGSEQRPGRSDLKDVIPIQDALNKSVMDLLIAMEFASFKQRYIIGIDVEVDEETGQPTDANAKNYGVDRMMAIPNEEAKVGQFDATDLSQFLRVQEKFWASAARVSGTPLHYFFITEGDFPSGESQKAAEARFSTRIEDCQTGWGNQWEDTIEFAMVIDGVSKEDLELDALWEDASPRSQSELADTAVKKKAIGVPRSQLLREQGYSDEEIDRFLQESDAEAMQNFALRQKSTAVTNPTGTQQGNNQNVQPSGENTRGVRQ